MKITRDVIVDLLPLYLADEASDDTKALIEQFLQQDPELTRLVQDQAVSELTAADLPIPLTREAEMQTLARTKYTLLWRVWLMAGALFFTLLTLMFRSIAEDGVRNYPQFSFQWFFGDSPVTLIGLAIISLTLWIGYFVARGRLRAMDL